MAVAPLAERFNERQQYINLIHAQIPERVRSNVTLTLLTDPFNMRVVARVKVGQHAPMDFTVTEDGKLSTEAVATICLMA